MGHVTKYEYSRQMIHHAPWVLFSPFKFSVSSGEMIENGCVVTEGGRIVAAGSFRELQDTYAGAVVRSYDKSVLLPALVNAHTHLELSFLREMGKKQRKSPYFTDWIKQLLHKRQTIDSPKEIAGSAIHALQGMSERGVGLIADIGNTANRGFLENGQVSQHTTILQFLELLGFSGDAEQKMVQLVESFTDNEPFFVAAHAPYSTSPELIRRIKQLASRRGDIFSIHVAESAEEVDFIKSGEGCFRDFLEERGGWDGTFTPSGSGVISYLDRLGVLDGRTMCVHAVHIAEEEIALLADRYVKICLCPASNRQLSSGVAPVGKILEHHILPALGTDSLASNSSLDIWREMQILREDHPGIDPAVVFSIATRGGAESLGYASEFGELLPGKQAAIISVQLDGRFNNSAAIYNFLTTAGTSVDVQWAD